MVGLRRTHDAQRPRVPISIGPGGFAPAVVLAVIFAAFAAKAHAPVVMSALLGGIGGTASLLVHELGHVRAARRFANIQRARVSLIWLGAATTFEGRYDSGREQARVALAGPQASFGLAVALLGACFLPMPVQVKDAVLVLALFNLAIGVLNLIPAHPLDGHKLVVGLLWCATGSEQKARRVLRRIGIGWAAVEFPAAAVMVFEKPQLGLAVALVLASVVAQRRLARRPAA